MSSPAYEIKKAGLADVPVIASLAKEIWPVVYKEMISADQITYMLETLYSEKALQEQIEKENQQFLILYVQQEPAGFVSFSPLPGQAVHKINKLYLAARLHNKGLGKLLIKEAEKAIFDAGSTQIILNVNRQNPARHFYKACGYQISESVDIPIGPFWMNDFVMAKNL